MRSVNNNPYALFESLLSGRQCEAYETYNKVFIQDDAMTARLDKQYGANHESLTH